VPFYTANVHNRRSNVRPPAVSSHVATYNWSDASIYWRTKNVPKRQLTNKRGRQTFGTCR